MKKISSRIVAVSILLVCVFLFSSCSEILLPSNRTVSVSIDEFMVKVKDKEGSDQTISSMPAIIGVPRSVSGDVIITEETTGALPIVRVYNLTSGKLLRTIDDGCPVGFVSDHLERPENASGIFYVNHFDIMYICSADGNEVISTYHDTEHPSLNEGMSSPNAPIFTDSLNGFAYNGVEYFVRDGAVVYEEARPLESDYFNASVIYKDLYYYISDKLVFVFNGEGTLLYEYRLPSYAKNANIFVLQSLQDEVADHPSIMRVHIRTVSIENADDLDRQIALHTVTVEKSFRTAFAFVVTAADADGIDIPPVAFHLRMH